MPDYSDYSDLDLSNPTSSDPYNQGAVDKFLYNRLVPDYLKSDFYKPHINPDYDPKNPSKAKLGYTPGTEDFAAHALPDVLSWLSPAAKGIGVAAKEVGPSLGIIAGPMANTAKMDAFKRAMQYLVKGGGNEPVSPEKMFDATGWFPSHNGELGFEISDKGMAPQPLSGIRRGGFLSAPYSAFVSHPELFEAYPGIKDAPVHIDPGYGGERKAVFNFPNVGHITLGGRASPRGLSSEQLSSLAHETQHYIQQEEGWPLAGSPSHYGELLNKNYGNIPPMDHPLGRHIDDWLSGIRDVDIPYEMYWRNPSEVEPRNVQTRLLNSKFGQPMFNYDVSSYKDVADILKNKGVALDFSRGRNFDPHKYGLRKWKTDIPVNPEDLDPAARAVFDKLATHQNWYTNDRPARLVDPRYPWYSEDMPPEKQFDYWKYLYR